MGSKHRGIDVDEWQWREMLLSEHGPSSPSERLVALVIYTHMSSGKPFAWPSQETIARRSQLSGRQVRRLTQNLSDAGWLCAKAGGPSFQRRNPKGWRITTYSPYVPEHLEQFVPQRPFKSSLTYVREDTQMSSPNPVEGFRNCSSEGAADIQPPSCGQTDPKVRTFSAEVRTPGCPTKSSSEDSIRSNHMKAQPPSCRAARFEIDSQKARDERIRKALPHFPPNDDTSVRMCVSGATLEDVRRVRAEEVSQELQRAVG